jgi:hypothetical protein
VFVLKSYANGWAEVRTEEGQVASVNLSHVMQAIEIEDIEKWKKMAGK